MKTILILSAKGGSSKTTLSRELAVAGSLTGRQVAIADLDAQRGITGWYGRREETGKPPFIVPFAPGQDLGDLASAADELIIDPPLGLPSYVATLISQADAVLVPVRPSPDDLATAPAVAALLAGHPQWAFVLVQTLPRSRLLMARFVSSRPSAASHRLASASGRTTRWPLLRAGQPLKYRAKLG